MLENIMLQLFVNTTCHKTAIQIVKAVKSKSIVLHEMTTAESETSCLSDVA
jgi:hypothetical protein